MSDSKVYIAERILSERKHRGVKQYLIKWKGYPMSENTWEPVENILCPTLLSTFENKKEEKSSRRKKAKMTHTQAINGHSSRRASLQRSKSQSPGHQTPDTTQASQLTPEPKTPTPKVSSIPIGGASPSPLPSPRPASQPPAVRTPEVHLSPRPPSNHSVQANLSSPGRLMLNHDSPKSPKLPQVRSKPDSIDSPKLEIDSRESQSPQMSSVTSTKDTRSSTESPPSSQPEPMPRKSPATPARQLSTQSPITPRLNDSVKSRTQISTSVQVSKPLSPVICSRPADKQTSVVQPKNRKFSHMNIVITDVTVHDHTITISESKTNQGFFREGNRNSVDATTQF